MKIALVVIAILLIVGSTAIIYNYTQFSKWLDRGHERIEGLSQTERSVDRQSLPSLLQNYLQKALGKTTSESFVMFTQSGDFRMKPESQMAKFKAEQVVSLVSPMFSWVANVQMNGLPITICDRLIDRHGELQARLFSSIPLAKGSGDSFLRGELLRYLAELPWYPMAILKQPDITWVQTEESKITGTISMKSISATVEYTFNEEGLIHSIFVPDREKSDGETTELKPWLGEFSNYEERDGILIPLQGQVSWLLESGKFTYFVGTITSYRLGGR